MFVIDDRPSVSVAMFALLRAPAACARRSSIRAWAFRSPGRPAARLGRPVALLCVPRELVEPEPVRPVVHPIVGDEQVRDRRGDVERDAVHGGWPGASSPTGSTCPSMDTSSHGEGSWARTAARTGRSGAPSSTRSPRCCHGREGRESRSRGRDPGVRDCRLPTTRSASRARRATTISTGGSAEGRFRDPHRGPGSGGPGTSPTSPSRRAVQECRRS